MGKQKTKKTSMDVDKPKAAKPAAAPAAPPAADDGWTTTPVTQNPFMLQLLGEQGAAALQSTMPAPTPEPATPRGGALGVAGKKIKKQESRKSKVRKAKKSAKATTVSEKLQARAQNEANQKKKKEKWKHLWE